MKKVYIFLSVLFMIIMIISCGGNSSNKNTDSSTGTLAASSTIDTTAYKASVASTASGAGYNSADYDTSIFTSTVTINLTSLTVDGTSFSGTTVTAMTGVTVANTTSGVVTITSTSSSYIKYVLSGTFSGTLSVTSSSAAYELYLNGVTINGTTDAAINLVSSTKAFIVLADGTTNTLTDSTSTTHTGTTEAVLYGAGSLIFSGSGTLSVTGNYQQGISCKDYIRICGGTMNVTATVYNAIEAKAAFIFDDGTLTIKATGTEIDNESKGIKVKAKDNATYAGKGYIYINGGTINITSVSKGITAAWDVDEDSTTYTTADPDPFVVINNGVISIKTTGTSYDYELSDGTNVSCAPEGIEGKSSLTINSGYISIITADDCLNAGTGGITINGGYIYCASTGNDAIDANGSLTITGGYLVAIGTSSPEGPFDCDTNNFTISGGTFVGIGGTISKPTSYSQNVVVLGSTNITLNEGSTLALVLSDGTVAFAYEIAQSSYTMILSSPDIVKGSYSIYTGVTATGSNNFNGMYLGSLAYSGGSKVATITVSSASGITKLGGQYFN